MADIDIVPKRRSYAWLWIVIAIVILAVLWFAFASRGTSVPRTGALPQAPQMLASLAAAGVPISIGRG